jgi:hypothetical protein
LEHRSDVEGVLKQALRCRKTFASMIRVRDGLCVWTFPVLYGMPPTRRFIPEFTGRTEQRQFG